ncbi:uncharacterized protein TNCV_3721811 [Trichonephila clavipes]|nr:uncharacterized protein TNCV_3721811 [Trichonephila clavipes]
MDLLKDTFGDRLISRIGLVNWPPRSCDLAPLDYFLWGCVKSLVYADKPQTLDHLFVLKMPRVKRRNHSAQMNSKRWCSDSVNTCVTEENILDPNIRIKQLLSTEKTGHSEVGNFIMSKVHSKVRKAYEAPTDVLVVDISVSFDDRWLTRGHTSLIGIACVIDILIDYVIDFEVICKVCRICPVAKREMGDSSADYDIWYEGHRKDCDINHSG